VYVATVPPNVRDYSNVTLHVARTTSGQGDAILGDIQANMPGINVFDWDYEPDGPKVCAT
jgi:hypothetical protein